MLFGLAFADLRTAVDWVLPLVLFPVGQALGQADLFGWVWTAFQWVSTVVGFFSAMGQGVARVAAAAGPEPVAES